MNEIIKTSLRLLIYEYFVQHLHFGHCMFDYNTFITFFVISECCRGYACVCVCGLILFCVDMLYGQKISCHRFNMLM